MAFANVPKTLAENAEAWGVPLKRRPAEADRETHARVIEQWLGANPGRAAAINDRDGSVVWAPAATFRTSDFLNGMQVSAAVLALYGKAIRVPDTVDPARFYLILSCQTLALIFGAENPPEAPPQTAVDDVQEVKRRVQEVSQAEPVKGKGKGGRQPSQDLWRPFWIEVACWAAANELIPADEQRPALRRHLLDWAVQPSDMKRPSEPSIDRALTDLFAGVTLKT